MEEEANRLKFLSSAVNLFFAENHTKKLLKFHYQSNLRSVAKDYGPLVANKFVPSKTCQHCACSWQDGNFKMQTIPPKVRSKKSMKCVEALRQGKALTKKQKVRAKWYEKRIFPMAVLTCKLCENKTKIPLQNPRKKKKKSREEKLNMTQKEEISTETKIAKKKKKRKDKTAGLNMSVIKSLHPSLTNVVKKKINTKIPQVPAPTTTHKVNAEKFEEKTASNISVPISKKTVNIGKLISKNGNLPTTKTSTEILKISGKSKPTFKSRKQKNADTISISQKANRLVQLANMLKKGNEIKNASANDKLKKFITLV